MIWAGSQLSARRTLKGRLSGESPLSDLQSDLWRPEPRLWGQAGVLSLLFFFLFYLLNRNFRRVPSRALSDWEATAVGFSQLHGAVLGG